MKLRVVFLALAVGMLLSASPALGQSRTDWSPFWQAWLAEVDVVMTPAERGAFDGLADDAQRFAFVRAFWAARDPFTVTARNEARDLWDYRVGQVLFLFKELSSELAQVALLRGVFDVEDAACQETRLRLLRWRIAQSAWAVPFFVNDDGSLRLASRERLVELFTSGECKAPPSMQGIPLGIPPLALAREGSPLMPASLAWLQEFTGQIGDVDPRVERDEATVALTLGAAFDGGSVVEMDVRLPDAFVSSGSTADRLLRNLVLRVVAIREGEEPVRIRHRFYLPLDAASETPRLVAQRVLGAGSYRVMVELESESGETLSRFVENLVVPAGEGGLTVPARADRARDNITQVAGRPRLLLQSFEGVVTGEVAVRVEAVGSGIRRVDYLVGGRRVASSSAAPYTATIDFGSRPRTARIEAVAFDADGGEMARTASVVNEETVPLRLKLRDPVVDEAGRLVIGADLTMPEGAMLSRLDLFAEEEQIASLSEGPLEFRLDISEREPPTYLRGVAVLRDGRVSEHVHAIGLPGGFEEMDVDLVELFASVTDATGRPVSDLAAGEFRISEDGVEQPIRGAEMVSDLPLSVGLLLDTSASMDRDLSASRVAAGRFLDSVLTSRDRATLLSFNHETRLVVPMTRSRSELHEGLEALSAWGGTTLHDSIMLTLHYFHGLGGRRALVVLTDGHDEHSRFELDELLDSAVRSGIIVHVIALGEATDGADLKRLAEGTGGTFSRVGLSLQLSEVYAAIEQEIRSQYRLSYQSSLRGTAFRSVEVETTRSGLEVRSLRGYYP